MHLLMNHSLPGVNAGYITRAKLLSGHLRATQEKLSKTMMDASGVEGLIWPFLASRKLGDPVRDAPSGVASRRRRRRRLDRPVDPLSIPAAPAQRSVRAERSAPTP
jgi:hypothetical protein